MNPSPKSRGKAAHHPRLRKRHAPSADISVPEAEPALSARVAGLRYVSDTSPGISRQRAGSGFRYRLPSGEPLRDHATLRRIRALAIPPAWRDVWICAHAGGHVQATGRDARGRKQYRYHERWREARDETKFDRMIAFGEALPRIRARTEADLARRGLPREKVLAAIVRLLETTLIRVGNEEYARENGSFGLTTMRNEHVSIAGQVVHFDFRGKSGVEHAIDLRDPRLAAIVRRCQDLPGELLFQYQDEDGAPHSISSDDVNAYLRAVSGQPFTAKDFRTWAGTTLAAATLLALEPCQSQAQAKRRLSATIASVAERLGNTPAVCRRCYVHPAVLELYLDGALQEALAPRSSSPTQAPPEALAPADAALLTLLRDGPQRDVEPTPPAPRPKHGGRRVPRRRTL